MERCAEGPEECAPVARRRLVDDGIDRQVGRAQQCCGLLQSLLAEQLA
jgi:hypothetical protein